jgi:hypothetical protein
VPWSRAHQLIEWLGQITYIIAPHRLRGPRDLEPLPREDVFQPIEREVIGTGKVSLSFHLPNVGTEKLGPFPARQVNADLKMCPLM